MNKNHLRNPILMGMSGLALLTSTHAGSRHPLWTFEPVAGFSPSITVSAKGMATIKYTVTNQSHKFHTLTMTTIQGIEPSGCTSSLGAHQSCTLSLAVNGSSLRGDVLGGPVLCEQTNQSQCYQPNQADSLAIHLTQNPSPPPIQQYTVTPSAGANGSISPSSAQVVNYGSTIIFTATSNAGYGVDQWLVDGSLAQTGGTTYQLANITANHTVNAIFGTVTLTPSVSTLALSINCQPSSSCATTTNAALTGNQRQITIQNTGSADATHVSVSAWGLPVGTSMSNDTCTGTLNAGGSCTITLTPGSVASSDASTNACTSGTQPVASTVTITADSGLSDHVNVYVLGYGCQYQGGIIYSVDDTTPKIGSIGGKVVSLKDQATPWPDGIVWSSNGGKCIACSNNDAADVSYDTIPGIDDLSTSSSSVPTFSDFTSFFSTTYNQSNPFNSPSFFSACNGATDGQCNTNNILTFYNQFITNYNSSGTPQFTPSSGPTPPSYYAAGICANYSVDFSGNPCSSTGTCYTNWYLPAICEMGPDSGNNICSTTNVEQNMVDNLSFLISSTIPCTTPAGCIAGDYWSSTEAYYGPQDSSWWQYFAPGSSAQYGDLKDVLIGVRCSRALS